MDIVFTVYYILDAVYLLLIFIYSLNVLKDIHVYLYIYIVILHVYNIFSPRKKVSQQPDLHGSAVVEFRFIVIRQSYQISQFWLVDVDGIIWFNMIEWFQLHVIRNYTNTDGFPEHTVNTQTGIMI